ncbi:MAG: hypothetical protein CBC13_06660 [Planctomycetia bacterium TMED53]|nr:MAG: hypothetical protein CBC13_06660 [Planctomycetia bacterium TMED53]
MQNSPLKTQSGTPCLPPQRQRLQRDSILLVLLLSILCGCGGGGEKRVEAPTPTPLGEFESLLARGRIDQARSLLEPFASPEQPNSVRGLARLGLGRCDLIDRRLEEAIRHLDKARRLLPAGADRAKAQLYLGEAYLRNKSVMTALNQLESAFGALRNPELKSRAAYMIVRTLDELGDPVPTLYREAAGQAYFSEYSEIWSQPQPVIVKSTADLTPKPVTPKPKVQNLTPPPALKLLKRNQWGSLPVRMSSVNPMSRPFRITIHHTADQSNLADIGQSDPREYLKILQKYCQNTLGWGDIGYHYLISKDGRVWEGRPMKFQGAHAGNNTLNRGNIGIALIGNFNKVKPSTAQIRSLQNLLGTLCVVYDISPSKIHGHSHLKPSDCPGKHLNPVLRELVRKLKSSAWAKLKAQENSKSR